MSLYKQLIAVMLASLCMIANVYAEEFSISITGPDEEAAPVRRAPARAPARTPARPNPAPVQTATTPPATATPTTPRQVATQTPANTAPTTPTAPTYQPRYPSPAPERGTPATAQAGNNTPNAAPTTPANTAPANAAPSMATPTAQQPGIMAQHEVGPRDSIWAIAHLYSAPYADVNEFQAVASIYRYNRNAFENNDVNHLRRGAVLYIPSVEEMALEQTRTGSDLLSRGTTTLPPVDRSLMLATVNSGAGLNVKVGVGPNNTPVISANTPTFVARETMLRDTGPVDMGQDEAPEGSFDDPHAQVITDEQLAVDNASKTQEDVPQFTTSSLDLYTIEQLLDRTERNIQGAQQDIYQRLDSNIQRSAQVARATAEEAAKAEVGALINQYEQVIAELQQSNSNLRSSLSRINSQVDQIRNMQLETADSVAALGQKVDDTSGLNVGMAPTENSGIKTSLDSGPIMWILLAVGVLALLLSIGLFVFKSKMRRERANRFDYDDDDGDIVDPDDMAMSELLARSHFSGATATAGTAAVAEAVKEVVQPEASEPPVEAHPAAETFNSDLGDLGTDVTKAPPSTPTATVNSNNLPDFHDEIVMPSNAPVTTTNNSSVGAGAASVAAGVASSLTDPSSINVDELTDTISHMDTSQPEDEAQVAWDNASTNAADALTGDMGQGNNDFADLGAGAAGGNDFGGLDGLDAGGAGGDFGGGADGGFGDGAGGDFGGGADGGFGDGAGGDFGGGADGGFGDGAGGDFGGGADGGFGDVTDGGFGDGAGGFDESAQGSGDFGGDFADLSNGEMIDDLGGDDARAFANSMQNAQGADDFPKTEALATSMVNQVSANSKDQASLAPDGMNAFAAPAGAGVVAARRHRNNDGDDGGFAAVSDASPLNKDDGFGSFADDGTDDQAFGSDDQGFGTNNQDFGTDAQGFGSDDQGFGADAQGFGSDDQGFGADDQGFGLDEQGLGGAEQSLADDGSLAHDSGESAFAGVDDSVDDINLAAPEGENLLSGSDLGDLGDLNSAPSADEPKVVVPDEFPEITALDEAADGSGAVASDVAPLVDVDEPLVGDSGEGLDDSAFNDLNGLSGDETSLLGADSLDADGLGTDDSLLGADGLGADDSFPSDGSGEFAEFGDDQDKLSADALGGELPVVEPEHSEDVASEFGSFENSELMPDDITDLNSGASQEGNLLGDVGTLDGLDGNEEFNNLTAALQGKKEPEPELDVDDDEAKALAAALQADKSGASLEADSPNLEGMNLNAVDDSLGNIEGTLDLGNEPLAGDADNQGFASLGDLDGELPSGTDFLADENSLNGTPENLAGLPDEDLGLQGNLEGLEPSPAALNELNTAESEADPEKILASALVEAVGVGTDALTPAAQAQDQESANEPELGSDFALNFAPEPNDEPLATNLGGDIENDEAARLAQALGQANANIDNDFTDDSAVGFGDLGDLGDVGKDEFAVPVEAFGTDESTELNNLHEAFNTPADISELEHEAIPQAAADEAKDLASVLGTSLEDAQLQELGDIERDTNPELKREEEESSLLDGSNDELDSLADLGSSEPDSSKPDGSEMTPQEKAQAELLDLAQEIASTPVPLHGASESDALDTPQGVHDLSQEYMPPYGYDAVQGRDLSDNLNQSSLGTNEDESESVAAEPAVAEPLATEPVATEPEATAPVEPAEMGEQAESTDFAEPDEAESTAAAPSFDDELMAASGEEGIFSGFGTMPDADEGEGGLQITPVADFADDALMGAPENTAEFAAPEVATDAPVAESTESATEGAEPEFANELAADDGLNITPVSEFAETTPSEDESVPTTEQEPEATEPAASADPTELAEEAGQEIAEPAEVAAPEPVASAEATTPSAAATPAVAPVAPVVANDAATAEPTPAAEPDDDSDFDFVKFAQNLRKLQEQEAANKEDEGTYNEAELRDFQDHQAQEANSGDDEYLLDGAIERNQAITNLMDRDGFQGLTGYRTQEPNRTEEDKLYNDVVLPSAKTIAASKSEFSDDINEGNEILDRIEHNAEAQSAPAKDEEVSNATTNSSGAGQGDGTTPDKKAAEANAEENASENDSDSVAQGLLSQSDKLNEIDELIQGEYKGVSSYDKVDIKSNEGDMILPDEESETPASKLRDAYNAYEREELHRALEGIDLNNLTEPNATTHVLDQNGDLSTASDASSDAGASDAAADLSLSENSESKLLHDDGKSIDQTDKQLDELINSDDFKGVSSYGNNEDELRNEDNFMILPEDEKAVADGSAAQGADADNTQSELNQALDSLDLNNLESALPESDVLAERMDPESKPYQAPPAELAAAADAIAAKEAQGQDAPALDDSDTLHVEHKLTDKDKDLDKLLQDQDFKGVSSYNNNEDETRTEENDMILPEEAELSANMPSVTDVVDELDQAINDFSLDGDGESEGTIVAENNNDHDTLASEQGHLMALDSTPVGKDVPVDRPSLDQLKNLAPEVAREALAAAAKQAADILHEEEIAEDLADATKDLDEVLAGDDFKGVSSYGNNEDETRSEENDMILPEQGEMPSYSGMQPQDASELTNLDQSLSDGATDELMQAIDGFASPETGMAEGSIHHDQEEQELPGMPQGRMMLGDTVNAESLSGALQARPTLSQLQSLDPEVAAAAIAAAADMAADLTQEAQAAEDLADASKGIDEVLAGDDFKGVSSYENNEDETHIEENDMILPEQGEMPTYEELEPKGDNDWDQAMNAFEQQLSNGAGLSSMMAEEPEDIDEAKASAREKDHPSEHIEMPADESRTADDLANADADLAEFANFADAVDEAPAAPASATAPANAIAPANANATAPTAATEPDATNATEVELASPAETELAHEVELAAEVEDELAATAAPARATTAASATENTDVALATPEETELAHAVELAAEAADAASADVTPANATVSADTTAPADDFAAESSNLTGGDEDTPSTWSVPEDDFEITHISGTPEPQPTAESQRVAETTTESAPMATIDPITGQSEDSGALDDGLDMSDAGFTTASLDELDDSALAAVSASTPTSAAPASTDATSAVATNLAAYNVGNDAFNTEDVLTGDDSGAGALSGDDSFTDEENEIFNSGANGLVLDQGGHVGFDQDDLKDVSINNMAPPDISISSDIEQSLQNGVTSQELFNMMSDNEAIDGDAASNAMSGAPERPAVQTAPATPAKPAAAAVVEPSDAANAANAAVQPEDAGTFMENMMGPDDELGAGIDHAEALAQHDNYIGDMLGDFKESLAEGDADNVPMDFDEQNLGEHVGDLMQDAGLDIFDANTDLDLDLRAYVPEMPAQTNK